MSKQPSKIGKYKILSQIGKGGMGAVFKAEHPTLDRTVIIKQLTTADSQDFIERFRREAKIMMDFRNEHIVQVYDHFKEDNAYFIVMEYVDGITLEDLIQEKRYLSSQAAVLIFNEICKALKYAHDQMVVHRDIKPANILISKEGVVKLVDFGVSTSLDGDSGDGLTKAGMTIGTPSYLAPEQIANAKNRDKRTDIYSMGVMFYEMLVGKKPFQGGFTPEIIAAIEKGRYTHPRKINPKISPLLQRVVKKAMHHKVKKRYQDLGLVQAKLSRLLRSYPNQDSVNNAIKGYLEGNEHLEPKPGRRLKIKFNIPGRLAGIAASSILIVALAAGAGFWVWQNSYQYEYLFPDDYGALQVKIKIRKRNKVLDDLFLKTSLYSETKGKLKKLGDIRFEYREADPVKKANYQTLISDPVYLAAGRYMILFYIENEQYRQNLYLAPRSLQKQRHDTRSGREIAFTVGAPPRQPVKLIYKLTDQQTGRSLPRQNDAVSLLYKGKWINWQDFIQAGGPPEGFQSGNRFRFRFKHKGYYTAYSNVTVQPEQNILKLNISLTPQPGELYLKSSDTDLVMRLNNSASYITGGSNPRYSELPPLSSRYQKLLLPPGDYFLTVKNRRFYFNATSTTQKLTIQSGKKIHVDLGVHSKDHSVKISIK